MNIIAKSADEFQMFVPIEFMKGKEVPDKKGKKRKMVFKGIASTPKTGADLDGEILEPTGFDYSPLLKSGHINWNHMAAKDPMAIVGEPTGASVSNGDFHIEGFLYDDSELAQKIYKAAEMLDKSGSTRKLGFSIEGMATERDPSNKKRITKAKIMNVAICPTPKNEGTIFNIVKGMEFVEDGSDMIIDVVNGDERVMIDKSFNIAIIKANALVISDDDFQKSVVTISNSIKDGILTEGIDEIKSHIASFKQALNGTVWVGGV